MEPQILGLHHVTAVTAHAGDNRKFYTQALGLRLVKKTVNQDDVSAYHLFYADKFGSPGTDLTFFDFTHAGARRHGTGTVTETALRVASDESLTWWAAHLKNLGVQATEITERAGRASLAFTDPEGQSLRLVSDGGAPGGTGWERSPVPQDQAIKGLDAVTLRVRHAATTARLLTEALGFRQTRAYRTADGREAVIYESGAGGPGTEVHLEEDDGPRGVVGRGGVHHVAFRTPDAAQHAEWFRRLNDLGIPTSEEIDRYYFRSLYFREPNGILFEIATDGPGFASDEDIEHLGERLSLPPFLEPRRAQIEAGLRPLETE